MTLSSPGDFPPPNKARLKDPADPILLLAAVKFPKSTASPVDAIVIKSMVSTLLGAPPAANIPLAPATGQ